MINPNAARKLEAATICGTPEYIAPEVILGKKYNQSVDYYGLGLLIFEMLSGYNPYKVQDFNGNTNMMFEMIVNEKIQFSFPKRNFTDSAKSICLGLMAKNPYKRLGNGKTGINEIKKHAYFKGINWEKLESREMLPPYVPTI